MRAVVQRVLRSSVSIGGELTASIERGLMVLIGVEVGDTEKDARYIADKCVGLRVFDDENGVPNLSVGDIGGSILAVSQFTLYASTVKGNRPSYIKAAKPDVAIPLYEKFLKKLEEHLGRGVGKGIFGADMKVSLLNDGPVTIIVDSKLKF